MPELSTDVTTPRYGEPAVCIARAGRPQSFLLRVGLSQVDLKLNIPPLRFAAVGYVSFLEMSSPLPRGPVPVVPVVPVVLVPVVPSSSVVLSQKVWLPGIGAIGSGLEPHLCDEPW